VSWRRNSGVARRADGERRTRAERGSALLIVFVFAAMIAIMLYAEMPVAVFEAKRQKEQLLIDRGNEYARAVKLFVRKFGMYPATVEQLENTNRMRFLRHRYKDPFTGKDNWRMLHAGPGGQLIDSKVKQPGLGNLPGAAGSANAQSSFGASTGAGFGSTSSGTAFGSSTPSASTGFGTSTLGSFGSDKSADAVLVPDLPQRPPAIPANGATAAASSSTGEAANGSEGEQSSSAPASPDDLRQQIAAVEQQEAGAGTIPPENAGQTATGQTGATGAGSASTQNAENNPSTQVAAVGATDSQNALSTVRNALGNGNPAIGQPLQGSGTSGSGMGQISSGGIAGVASNAHGHSIKTVNDQTDYSLWEFYYDPVKDATRNMPGLPGAQNGAQPGAAGTNGGNQGLTAGSTGQSIFGQSGSNQSGFGQSSQTGFGQSSFGQSNSTSSSPQPAPAPANPPQQ
jgi:hypothetical protein